MDRLSILSHQTVIGGVQVQVKRDDVLPAGMRESEVKALRESGALGRPEFAPDSAAEVGSGDADPLTLSVEALATLIDSEGLNAPATVALAREDPARAQAVIDAEQLAHGGDGRRTVLDRLEKLVARTP